jgi:hypothetical protein
MMAVIGILFTDAVGLPKFWLAGAEVSRNRQQSSCEFLFGCSSSKLGRQEVQTASILESARLQ